MTTITQIREDIAKFDLVISDNMPEVFTDGISQLLLGYPTSKITFHSLTSPGDSENRIEQRQGILRLVIATPVLLELCKNILASAQSSVDALSEGGKQMDAQLRKIMDGVNITMPSADEGKKLENDE